MGRRISKEFLHPSILEGVNNKIGNLDSLETDAKGNMVQAINELVEKLDNSAEIEAKEAEIAEGKELIANAVGEPLTAEESFDEMSNDINSLLSIFKTNMMNNGITVEGGDKFKALIDKIATMVEEGSGKGIQFVEGTVVCADSMDFKNKLGDSDVYLDYVDLTDVLSFEPMFIILTHISATNAGGLSIYTNPSTGFYFKNLSYTKNKHLAHIAFYDGLGDTYVITSGRLTIPVASTGSWTYYAIGVGEEDTTLRDSLASILENKGVDVTEEDDMASLISKVDIKLNELNDTIDNGIILSNTSTSGFLTTFYSQTTDNNRTTSTSDVLAESFNIQFKGTYTLSYDSVVDSRSQNVFVTVKLTDSSGTYTVYSTTDVGIQPVNHTCTLSITEENTKCDIYLRGSSSTYVYLENTILTSYICKA